MAILSNLMSIYQSYPWVFDGIIICTLLGVLFRILFEKGKIGKEEQAKKLGGIFGFFLGIAMIGYMQYRGWTLFVDGGPWIFSIIIISLIMVFWAVIDGYFEGKSRSITLPIAFVVAAGLIYAFLNKVPSYMAGVNDLFGGSVWIWHLIMWCLMIFILFWALTGLMAGGYGEVGGGGWGILGKILKAPFKGIGHGINWFKNRREKRKKKKKDGVSTPDDLEEDEKETDQTITDAEGEAEKTKEELEDTKTTNLEIIEILKKILELAKSTQSNIVKLKPDECKGIATELQKLLDTLAKLELPGEKILKQIAVTKDSIEQAKSSVKWFSETAPIYTKIPELIELIKKIDDGNTQAIYQEHVITEQNYIEKEIKTRIVQITKEFEEKVDSTLTVADVKETTEKLKEITTNVTSIIEAVKNLIDALNATADLPAERQEAARAGISEACTKIIDLITVTIELLESFNKTTIDAKLMPSINFLEHAFESYKEHKKPIKEAYNKVMQQVQDIIAQVQAILGTQMKDEDKIKLRAQLTEILTVIRTQKTAMQSLVGGMMDFVRTLIKIFKEDLSEEQKVKLQGILKRSTGKEVTEEFDIDVVGKKIQAFPKEAKEAKEILTKKITLVKAQIPDVITLLDAGKGTIDAAMTALKKAATDLDTLLKNATGLKPEQRTKLQNILTNLTTFIEKENEIRTTIEDYEKFVTDFVNAWLEEVAKGGGKRRSLRVETILNSAIKQLNTIQEYLNLLGEEEIIIYAEIKELAEEEGVEAPRIPPAPSNPPEVGA
ncbi:hypothetical protein KY338_05445 [Candidatus Woesearchaeota archaeon]|nr:hypothetical protein [Candidatus Woesearchaeota archaeon]MBW3006347.1 hypothetical protein [Candidatus Woesearchaeota archaeon]